MTNSEIIDQFKQLTTAERLAVIEASTRLIREDLSQPEANETPDEKQLAQAQPRSLQITKQTGN